MLKKFCVVITIFILSLVLAPTLIFAVTHDISYSSSGFSPSSLTIAVGDTVRWTNTGSGYVELASDSHPTHTLYSPLNLGVINPGSNVTLSFTTAGSYGYHDHLNSNLTGIIIAQAPSVSPTPQATPISSPVVSSSPSTTLPVTGTTEITLLLSIVGLIFVIIGFVTYKRTTL